MGKIGDLWVRLGLKKDEYTTGLKQAEKEAGSFGSSVASISGKAKVAFAAVAAGVVAVFNALKDLSKQNQSFGDLWNRTAAGMTASWDTFKTSVAATDFSHLFSNMREAARLARQLYDATDAMGEINTAYQIASSEQLEKINELRVALQDANLTDGERLAKGKELLEIYEKLEKEPTRGLLDVKDKTLDYYMQRMGEDLDKYTTQGLEKLRRNYVAFFKWLGTEQGQAYNDAAKIVAKTPLGINSGKGQSFMRNAANNGVSEFARMAVAYNDKMGEKDRQAIQDAVVAYNTQVAKYSTETRRIQTLMNSIEAHGAGGSTPGGMGSPERVDTLQQELALLRQELAEEQQIAALDAEFQREADAAYESLREAAGYTPIKPFDDETQAAFDAALRDAQRYGEALDAAKKKSDDLARSISENLVDALENGLVGAFDALAEVMGGVTDGGMEAVARALIEPLADMAIKAGTLIMMSGTAIEALKESLIGFFGGNAVIAGGALIAVGMAAKAGLAAIGNKGGSGVSSYSSSTTPISSPSNVQTAELVVHVEGTVKGSDIILAGNNTLNSWSR